MSPDQNGPMNNALRSLGNRSRTLPNIGQLSQTPAVQAANIVQSQQPAQQPQAQPQAPAPSPMSAPPQSPMAAPQMGQARPPQSATFHPPGEQPDPNQYTYEPHPSGGWMVYPPGVTAPSNTNSASLPRAASTADYRRLQEAFTLAQRPQQPGI